MTNDSAPHSDLPTRSPTVRVAPRDDRHRTGRRGAGHRTVLGDLPEKLRTQLDVVDGHWIWTGQLNNKGYGVKHAAYVTNPDRPRQKRPVHVLAWEALIGPVAAGLELDHLCAFTACANPACLEEVTHAENQRRAGERLLACRRAGHPRTGENVYVDPNGRTRCRPCARELSAQRNRKEVA